MCGNRYFFCKKNDIQYKRMPNKHYIIVVPGLKDRAGLMRFVTKGWKTKNLDVLIHVAPWEDKTSYEKKIAMLLVKIDALAKRGKVTLVGVSAGGSLVMNAFAKRKEKVHRVINVSGRLRMGGFPSIAFALSARNHPAFVESVEKAEKVLPTLSQKNKEKIMTISPIFDGVVPLSAIPVDGAYNLKIPLISHALATGGSFVFFRKRINDFIGNQVKN